MKVYITHGWRYAYDRSSKVYRAIKPDWKLSNPKGEEVNAYHRDELLWQIEHIDGVPKPSSVFPQRQNGTNPQIVPPSESFTDRLLDIDYIDTGISNLVTDVRVV